MDGDARSLVSCADFHDTVGADLEDDLELRNSKGEVLEFEYAEEMDILGNSKFSSEDLDRSAGGCKRLVL
jgi:hypothetical protein